MTTPSVHQSAFVSIAANHVLSERSDVFPSCQKAEDFILLLYSTVEKDLAENDEPYSFCSGAGYTLIAIDYGEDGIKFSLKRDVVDIWHYSDESETPHVQTW